MDAAEREKAYEAERNLHQLLRDREDELGITVTEAAKRAGLPLRQYQKYRNEDVIPQGPSLKRLGKGLGLTTRALRDAVGFTEAERAAGEEYVNWLEAPATREDLQKLEGKLFKIEEQLREIRALLAADQRGGDMVIG